MKRLTGVGSSLPNTTMDLCCAVAFGCGVWDIPTGMVWDFSLLCVSAFARMFLALPLPLPLSLSSLSFHNSHLKNNN